MKSKRTTITDIAKALKITPSAVSKALSNHPRISDATKNAVQAMAEKLNYQPNYIASALRKGKSNLVGVIVPAANINFFSSAVKGIEDILNKEGFRVIITQSYDDFAKECKNIDTLLQTQVDGIIVSMGNKTTKFDHFKKVKDKGVPLILFDRIEDSLGVSSVVIDDYQGAYKATEHLISKGYKKIAHFGGYNNISLYKNRLRGFKDALTDHDLPILKEFIFESDLEIKDGYKLMSDLIQKNMIPDAVFASSDYTALGVSQVLLKHDIRVPEEVGIVGFSNEPFTSYVTPSLTSVNQYSEQLGQVAAKIFLEQVKKDAPIVPSKTVINPELIIRDSSMKTLL